MNCRRFRLLVALAALLPVTPLPAAVFNRAEISRVYNQVTLIDPGAGRRPAVPQDVVTGDVAVQTGLQSRAELLFPDNTFTRLASNTVFSFRGGTREMDLKSGAILFQVPPGSGGADIHAAAITAAITGTTGFVERIGGVFKLIVVEGEVRVYLRNRVGESMLVRGGQMLLAPMSSTSVQGWQTVDVDIAKLVKSSALFNARVFGPLPPQAMRDITRVVADQQAGLTRGRLNPTNLVIDGGVSRVLLVNNETRNRNEAQPVSPARTRALPVGPRPTPPPDLRLGGGGNSAPLPTPNPNPTPNANPTPSATPGVISQPDPYVISSATSIVTRPQPTITTNDLINAGRVFRGNAVDGSASKYLFGSTSQFDLRLAFDDRFGRNFEPEFAPAGVAVFRFGTLRIIGAPAIDVNGGPRDLALVATKTSRTTPGIVTGGPGGNWDLSGLRSLFLGTADSSIVIDAPIALTASGSTFRYLQLYARGEQSDALLGTAAYLVGDLYIDSERDTILDGRADVVARRLLLTAGRDLSIAGLTNASFTQLVAGRALLIDGSVNSTQLFAFANDAKINGSVTADYVNLQLSGDLTTGRSGSKISTIQFVLKADNFELNGDNGAGTTFDLTRLAKLDLDVRRLTLGSDFTLPPGVVGNLKLGVVDAPTRALFGFDTIVTTGSGDDRLRDLSVRSFSSAGNLLVSRDVAADFLAVGNMLAIGREFRPYSSDPTTTRIASAQQIGIGSGINFAGRDGTSATLPGDGFSLQLFADEILFTTGSDFGINGANLNGGNRTSAAANTVGGSGGTLDIGTAARPIVGNV
ncbi:MAG: FecR domain-containing protein, partial [Chthoniobacterales bacterium]